MTLSFTTPRRFIPGALSSLPEPEDKIWKMMNFIKKAPRLLAPGAIRLAVTVLPVVVAIAMVPESASATGFDISTAGGCTVTTGSGTCGFDEASSVGADANGNWVDLYTSGDVSAVNNRVILSHSENGDGASGSVFAGEVIPLSWDFFINDGGSGGSVSWTMTVDLTSQDTNLLTYSIPTQTVAVGSHVQGSALMTVAASGDPINFNIHLVTGGTLPFSINVPAGSTIDFNPAGGSTTPEPASLLLSGLGMAALALWKKKRPTGF